MFRPRVFIGSSSEARKLCGALQVALQRDARVSAWYQTFPIAAGTLDALLEKFSKCDFAIFVFSPEDTATIREREYAIARDNVLFEAGLFMGMHGKGRAFIVSPIGVPSFHMPTDLAGITTAGYMIKDAQEDPDSAMGAAAHLITKAMETVSNAQNDVTIIPLVTYNAAATYPLKLNLKVKNMKSVSVLIESDSFTFTSAAKGAPNGPVMPGSGPHKPAFKVGVETIAPGNIRDIYALAYVLNPGDTTDGWVPYDPAIGEAKLTALLNENNGKIGTWGYRCVWHSLHPTARTYERDF